MVQVRDHGPGIPEEALKNICRPFFRVGEDRNPDTGGVGLGLAIADRAIRLPSAVTLPALKEVPNLTMYNLAFRIF